MNITFPDGSVREYQDGMTPLEIAASIGPRLAKSTLLCRLDGERADAFRPIHGDHSIQFLTWDDEDARWGFRHTASHILAQAVKRLYPDAVLAIGPAIENGFYYDFDKETPFSADDLAAIEKEMERIEKEDLKLERFELPREEAIAYMKVSNEPYKVELI